MYNFDKVLTYIGGFGIFQIAFVILYYFQITITTSASLAPVFVAATPNFRCYNEQEDSSRCLPEDDNMMQEPFKHCEYPANISMFSNFTARSKCQHGYIYDCTVMESTITTEWDLVCDRRTLHSISSFLYFGGNLVAALFGGMLADVVGRKPIMLISTIGAIVVNFGMAFVPSFSWFCVARFILPLFVYNAFLSAFIYSLEVSSSNWRNLVGIHVNTFFGVGIIFYSGLAYLLRPWRKLQSYSTIFFLPFPVIFYFIPESPRWLFAYNKTKLGKKSAEFIARVNRRKISPKDWESCRTSEKVESSVTTKSRLLLLEILKLPRLRWITLNMMFQWATISLVYYGLTLNSGSLAGDLFVNTALIGVMDTAGCALSHPVTKRIGCRRTLFSAMIISAVGCLMSILTNVSNVGAAKLGVAFAMIGKFAISGAFAIVYLHTPEIFPTEARTTGVGVCSTAARIGNMLSPFALQAQESVPWLTQVVFGILSILSAALSLHLPETHMKPMLTTLEEAEFVYSKTERDSKKDSVDIINEKPASTKQLL